ncbi:YebC/PmpR family DNA-binding transcriptional regulator [Alkalicoccus halolimnae]|uniref:Probable transcriptional regulatory protein FTX54_006565 n=1 Tax=Alkalicoccus halolimnae TaxID=1667239 RepID=A0A5C7F733_9BACI|nr:YebC/PmpR family DNA-binding transcriptional regulator [Alkalicoccus halolimnae]TXF86521.1 YebC/PmpR family DNA-binding transcriptional regulator [Alkalicoccus halolimnae]
MAGHSKWSNIKHRKGRQDAKKGKVFTKVSKEIFQAVRNGGENQETNAALRMALEKAKQVNMPNDNVERTIKKALGNVDGITYEEIVYEGYAPHGIAVYVETLTENKNRTAADIRLAFNKNGGNLGENGCVSFMFSRRGWLIYEKLAEIDEDEIMLTALEAGAEDVTFSEDAVEIFTQAEEMQDVKKVFKEIASLELASAEAAMVPAVKTALKEEDLDEVMQLIEALEDNDDVQRVAHSAVL